MSASGPQSIPPRPKPIYATERNTRAVRTKHELGGYLKNRAEIDEWERQYGERRNIDAKVAA